VRACMRVRTRKGVCVSVNVCEIFARTCLRSKLAFVSN
jgi:hypothetical protein